MCRGFDLARFEERLDHRLEAGIIQRHELADVDRRRPIRLRDEQPKQRLGSADVSRKQHGGHSMIDIRRALDIRRRVPASSRENDVASVIGRRSLRPPRIRSLYPAVTENHLRYLEKWGLVRQSNRPRDRREYSFADLTTIKQVAGELERGTPLRVVLRALLAERQGQLELDFRRRPRRSPTRPARRSSASRRTSRS